MLIIGSKVLRVVLSRVQTQGEQLVDVLVEVGLSRRRHSKVTTKHKALFSDALHDCLLNIVESWLFQSISHHEGPDPLSNFS